MHKEQHLAQTTNLLRSFIFRLISKISCSEKDDVKHDMFRRSQWAESRKWDGHTCCWFESEQPEQKYSVLWETVLGQSQPGKHTQVDQTPAHVVMQTHYILVTHIHIKTTLIPNRTGSFKEPLYVSLCVCSMVFQDLQDLQDLRGPRAPPPPSCLSSRSWSRSCSSNWEVTADRHTHWSNITLLSAAQLG